MAKHYVEKEYAANSDELLSFCASALEAAKCKILKGDPNFGVLTARKTTFSVATQLNLDIYPVGMMQSNLKIEYFCPNSFGKPVPIETKKMRRKMQETVDEFLTKLDYLVARSNSMNQ